MASLGHIAVGMAAARAYRSDLVADHLAWRPTAASFIFWSALSFLPDADVIGFSFGVHYGDPWGHRGATHSLFVALIGGIVVALLARFVVRSRSHPSLLRTGVAATLVLASHGLLDTLTNGGLGIALLWPFDLTRYFAPWHPIPVSPIGLGYLSPYGLYVAGIELLIFSPLFLYALYPRRRAF